MVKKLDRKRKMLGNAGFTMVEMIIVVAIIAVLTTIGAIGVQGYLNSADKNERDHTAKTAYLGIQDYLTELKKTGELEDFNMLVKSYSSQISTKNMQDILKNNLGGQYDSYYPKYIENHEGTVIVAVPFSGADRSNPFYDVLFKCLGQEDILENAFLIEYNQTTGIVQSVFFSKTISGFNPATMYNTSAVGDADNVIARDDVSLDKKKQGYYGVYDTASIADEYKIDPGPKDEPTASDNNPDDVEEDEPLDLHTYRLVNSDRIYLHIKDVYDPDAVYDIKLYGATHSGTLTSEPLYQYSSFKMDGKGNGKGKNGSFGGEVITLPRNVTEYSTTEVLDAVDVEMAKYTVSDLDGLCSAVKTYVVTKGGKNIDAVDMYFLIDCEHHNLVDEYFKDKLHEFGIANEDEAYIVAVVESHSGKVRNPATNEPFGAFTDVGGPINPVFRDYDAKTDTYTLSCTRHLNNVRDYPSGRHYRVVRNINLRLFEQEDLDAKVAKDEVDRHWCTDSGHPQKENTFESLGCSDTYIFTGTFTGMKNYEGVDTTALKARLKKVKEEECYKISGVRIKTPNSKEPVGFISTVNANTVIGGIILEDFEISGSVDVGAATGYNAGTVAGVFANNVKVSGKKMVGGVIGSSYNEVINCHFGGEVQPNATLTSKSQVSIPNLDSLNDIDRNNLYRTDVNKYRCMGGVVGNAIGEVQNCSIHAYVDEDGNTVRSKVNTNVTKQFGDINVGGVVGLAMANVTECTAEGVDVKGYENVGGLIGYGTKHISNCTVYGPARIESTGDSEKQLDDFASYDGETGGRDGQIHPTGGLVGYVATEMKIKNCYMYDQDSKSGEFARIEVIGLNTKHIGGLAGTNHGYIEDCDVHVTYVEGYMDTGGLVGKMYGPIKGCNLWITEEVTVAHDGDSCLGGLVGVIGLWGTDWANGIMIIEDCHVMEGTVHGKTATTYRAGGLVGSLDREVKFVNCSNNADIVVDYKGERVSGLIGSTSKTRNKGNVIIENCENHGDIILQNEGGTGSNTIGGVAAYLMNELTIKDCKNDGDIIVVNGESNIVGGILGKCDGYAVVTGCENHGNVYTAKKINKLGGIVGTFETPPTSLEGAHQDNTLYVENCKNYGNFSLGSDVGFNGVNPNTGGEYIGGIIGYVKKEFDISGPKDCYNYGNISAANSLLSRAGGIVGCYYAPLESTYSFSLSNCHNEGSIGVPIEYKNTNSKVNPLITTDNCMKGSARNNNGNGGLIGSIWPQNQSGETPAGAFEKFSIVDCSSKGKIYSNMNSDSVGGLLGRAQLDGKGIIKELEIKNTTSDVSMELAGGNKIAGLVGYEQALITNITDCSNSGNITCNVSSGTAASGNIAGAIGYSDIDNVVINITNFENTAAIKVKSSITYDVTGIGGVVGNISKATARVALSNVKNKDNEGIDVTVNETKSGKNIGGIVGYCSGILSIDGAFSYVPIAVSGGYSSYVGGIIGYHNCTTASLSLANANNSGNITLYKLGDNYIGGIVGSSNAKSVNITGANNSGDITIADGNNKSRIGGIIGYVTTTEALTIANSSNIGNVTIEKGNMTNIGGILGYAEGKTGTATINNVHNEGTIEFKGGTSVSGIGGIVGYFNRNGGTIVLTVSDNVYNKGNITLKEATGGSIGGVIGSCTAELSIDGASNKGNIKIEKLNGNKVAGIIGNYDYATSTLKIFNTKNEGFIEITAGTGNCIGGILGYDSASLNINKVSNFGTIFVAKNADNIGGMMGQIKGISNTINEAYNEGNITIEDGAGKSKVAGLLGYLNIPENTTITNSGNKGSILIKAGNTNNIGGILGYSDEKVGIVTIANVHNEGSIELNGGTSVSGIGGIVGYFNRNSGTVELIIKEGSYNKGNILLKEAAGNNIGGIIGNCSAKSTFDNISSGGSITVEKLAAKKIGGIVGYAKGNLTMQNVEACGSINVIAPDYVGGLIGQIEKDGTAELVCVSNVAKVNIDIKDKAMRTGGLIGQVNAINSADIHNCYSMGTINYAYASISGSLFGQLNYSAGKTYNCYFGGHLEKTSATADIDSNGNRAGYLIGRIENTTSVVQDCYAIAGCISIENYPDGFETTQDTKATSLRRIGNFSGQATLVTSNTAYLIYQTHRNSTDAVYKANAFVDESEFGRLCYIFNVPANYTGDAETDIKYLMASWVESDKNAEDYNIVEVEFSISNKDGYSCNVQYDGHSFDFDAASNSFKLPTVNEAGQAKPVSKGDTISFVINDTAVEEANKIKDTDLVVVKWIPEGGTEEYLTASSGYAYATPVVNGSGKIAIEIKSAPVITINYKDSEGDDISVIGNVSEGNSSVKKIEDDGSKSKYAVLDSGAEIKIEKSGDDLFVLYNSNGEPVRVFKEDGDYGNVTFTDISSDTEYYLVKFPADTVMDPIPAMPGSSEPEPLTDPPTPYMAPTPESEPEQEPESEQEPEPEQEPGQEPGSTPGEGV